MFIIAFMVNRMATTLSFESARPWLADQLTVVGVKNMGVAHHENHCEGRREHVLAAYRTVAFSGTFDTPV